MHLQLVIIRFRHSLHAGFYGTSETQTFNEASSSGSDYLAEVCREWEAEARKAQLDRVAVLRTGALAISAISFLEAAGNKTSIKFQNFACLLQCQQWSAGTA